MWATINMYDWQIDDNMWFAFTHYRLDFFGYGNRSGKLRTTHIKGHLALFERTLAQLAHFQKTVPFLFVVASEPCIRFEGDEAVVTSTTAQLLDGQAAMFCTKKEKKSDEKRM